MNRFQTIDDYYHHNFDEKEDVEITTALKMIFPQISFFYSDETSLQK